MGAGEVGVRVLCEAGSSILVPPLMHPEINMTNKTRQKIKSILFIFLPIIINIDNVIKILPNFCPNLFSDRTIAEENKLWSKIESKKEKRRGRIPLFFAYEYSTLGWAPVTPFPALNALFFLTIVEREFISPKYL
ncbi:MAG: hypothetical protein ACE5PM_08410, partial [Candidatus Hydrothermarchaeales archaeon]